MILPPGAWAAALAVFFIAMIIIGAGIAPLISDLAHRLDRDRRRWHLAAAVTGVAERWQHCDWCDPAGDTTQPADCTCPARCTQQPMALWCGAGKHLEGAPTAEQTERAIGRLLADLDRRDLL